MKPTKTLKTVFIVLKMMVNASAINPEFYGRLFQGQVLSKIHSQMYNDHNL